MGGLLLAVLAAVIGVWHCSLLRLRHADGCLTLALGHALGDGSFPISQCSGRDGMCKEWTALLRANSSQPGFWVRRVANDHTSSRLLAQQLA